MDLWLVRHGEAVSEREDPARPLTPDGAAAIRDVADAVALRMGSLDVVAASGKTRAVQTAEILCAAAGYPADRIAETAALSPNASPEAFVEFLAGTADAQRILCVGHLPSIAAIASYFLSASDPVRLRFGPGTVCRIRVDAVRRGGGELLLFV